MLTRRALNRTLLLRQHLLRRTTVPALQMVEHLVGLQAQDNLPPYLSLAARIEGFDPEELSGALARREAVRLLTLRGTIHVLTPDDALALRPWVQPALDQQSSGNQMSRPARDVPADDLVSACHRLLADGPLPVRRLGELMTETFEGVPAGALAHKARGGRRSCRCRPAGCGSGPAAWSTRPWSATWTVRRRRSTCRSSSAGTCVPSAPPPPRT